MQALKFCLRSAARIPFSAKAGSDETDLATVGRQVCCASASRWLGETICGPNRWAVADLRYWSQLAPSPVFRFSTKISGPRCGILLPPALWTVEPRYCRPFPTGACPQLSADRVRAIFRRALCQTPRTNLLRVPRLFSGRWHRRGCDAGNVRTSVSQHESVPGRRVCCLAEANCEKYLHRLLAAAGGRNKKWRFPNCRSAPLRRSNLILSSYASPRNS